MSCAVRPNRLGGCYTKYKVYLVAEFVQRLESPQSNGLGAGQPITEALDKVDVSSAKIEPVQRLESPPSKDLSALDKSDSGIDPTSKTDSQQNIFPSLTAPQS